MVTDHIIKIDPGHQEKLDEYNLGERISFIYHVCHTASTGKQYNKNWDTVKRLFESSNFNKLHLHGIDFHYACLICADFIEASIVRCSLDTCELHGADFSQARIQCSDFSDSIFDHTIFDKTRFDNVQFHGTYMINCTFKKTEFINVDFSGADMEEIHFENCTFKNVLFDNIKTQNCTGLPFGDN
jgi:uncharacterized protein YjbI with pentapeptide repeats